MEIDNDEGWIDEAALLSEDKREEFETMILPIKLALMKVSSDALSLTCKLICSNRFANLAIKLSIPQP